MIEALAGKKIAAAHRPTAQRSSEDKWTNSNLLLQSYQFLFSFLHSQGAFLNIIRPEFLLDLDDFMRVKVWTVFNFLFVHPLFFLP